MYVFPATRRSLPAVLRLLRRGRVVAAPTETAYGLLADATSAAACHRVFALKGRQLSKASAIVVSSLAMACRYGQFSPAALALARRHWPGPLTLVVPARLLKPASPLAEQSRVARGTGGQARGQLARYVVEHGWVGLRVPAYPWLRSLVNRFGRPLTATSANRAGRHSPYSSRRLRVELAGRGLDVLVDAGRLPRRPLSTVVLVNGNRITVLRQGAVKLKSQILSTKS